MPSDRERPEAELKHGYSPKVEEGYKPVSAKATTPPSTPPKPPAGSGAGSRPDK